jgi:alanine racemase
MRSVATGVRRRASIDLDAIIANARISTSDLSASVADLRADAYGHGFAPVLSALGEAGVRTFLASNHEDAALVRSIDPHMRVHVGGSESAARPLPSQVIGLGLYGLGVAPGLRPTLRLSGEVIAVKTIPGGSGVSYGYTYRTSAPTRLALVALGFADGVPRVASNRAPVLVNGFRALVAGRIAMDQFVVDLGDHPASVGDEAILLGDASRDEPTVEDWAEAARVRPEVILSGLGKRIERAYSRA